MPAMVGHFGLFTSLLSLALSTAPKEIIEDSEQPFSHQVWTRQVPDDPDTRIVSQGSRAARQVCEGPGRQRGRCLRMEDCVLQDVYQDYVKNRGYFCVLKNNGGIGVCCPDSVSAPVVYKEDMFSGNSRPQRQQPSTPRPTGPSNLPADIYPLGEYRVCGRNGKKIERITTAAPTKVKDWPWMAALAYRSTLKQFCGGTLITRRHVLTAAHCFPKKDPNDVVVILGDYDLKRPDESKSKVFTVAQMIVHEDFDVTSYENDITILVLNASAAFNSYIQPCCLPAPGPRFANLTTVVTGWGKLEFGGISPNVLMEVPVPVWEQKRCVPNFAQTIFDTNLCAGAFEGGKDACQGDSGGPLVMQRGDDRWAIVGIVSWGIRCGEKDKPGVYTRVNDYLDWIAQTIL